MAQVKRSKLWLLAIFSLLTIHQLVSANVLEEGEGGEGEENEALAPLSQESIQFRTAALVIVTLLIVLSILFEFGKDKVEETTSEEMEPIVEHLWQELTVLGFLSVLTFLLTKFSSYLDYPIGAFFRPDETEWIAELLESIHMLLFAVMVVFIIEVLLLVRLGEREKRKWRKYQHLSVHDPQKVVAMRQEYKHHERASIWCAMCGVTDEERLVNYATIRQEFISPRDKSAQRLKNDFDMSLYFSYIMGEVLGDMVEISPLTWLLLELFFALGYAVTYTPGFVVLTMYFVFGWMLLAALVLVSIHLRQVYSGLVPELKKSSSINETTGLLTDLDDPDFLYLPLKQRSMLGRLFLGPPANKHQLLFIFDRKGKHFLVAVIRFIFLLVAIYIGCLLPIVYYSPNWWWGAWQLPLALLPIFILAFLYAPRVVRLWVIVCNIEMMKRPDVISRVVRHQKTKKSLQTLKVIQMMKFKALKAERKQGEEADRKRPDLPADKRKLLKEVFDLFDKDGSGTVSATELVEVFETLGQTISEQEARDLIIELDVDGDGELDFEEFCGYLQDQMLGQDLPVEEIAHSMFTIFDVDGSGSITADEFRNTISKIGTTLTVSDVQAIIEEIDEDGDNHISLEEFQEYVIRHLKEEKKGRA